MIDICLLGTGGMMPLPERALTSLYVRYGGRALLIDCGEGTQTAIRCAKLRFKPIDAILITHFHADHISGLPGLLLTLGNEGRTETLNMYGPIGLEQTVNALRIIVPELPYDIKFHEFNTAESTHFSCLGLDADAFALDHRIPCFGYRLALKREGKFDSHSARAKGIPVELWGRLQRGESIGGFTPDDVLGAPRRGVSILYATDTRPVAAIKEFGTDADLLILEGIFGDQDKQERAEITHHMMMQEAAHIAKCSGAGELWLTHFSPATSQPSDFINELKSIFANTVIGTDGMSRTLRFKD